MNSKELWKMSVEFNDNELEKIIPYQVTDETSSDCGGLYDDSLGFCGATHYETMKLLRNLGYAYCTKESKYFEDEEILKRIELCMQFQKSRQRKSGLIDLRTRNYDSPPDTAFAMNIPAVIIYMARNTKEMKTAEKLEQILMPYVKSSALAMKNDGGFHTPNHRWIISGALAIAQELYPELELTEAIYSYLNETIDLNEDGLYSEKSFLYSAYINDKLMNVYHTYHDEKILNAIYKNCLCMIELMNNDYTLLTSISIRQDKGKKIYPTQFLNCFYFVAKKFNDMQLWNALDSVVKHVGIESPELLYLFKRLS